MDEEETLREFDIGAVTVFPGPRNIHGCVGRLTTQRFIITDRKGGTEQVHLSDIESVRVQGMVMKCVIVGTRHGGYNMATGRNSRVIADWIREAL